MISFDDFEKKTNLFFKDKNLLKQAFIHRSYINENPRSNLNHNERLEFLGDAILEMVTTLYLYHKYPNHPEGDLTAFRSALVNSNTLAQVAFSLSMNDFLLLSKGESRDNGKARQYILANTFEAYLGALYLDQGYDACVLFVQKNLLHKTEEIVSKKLWKDSKSLVQEKAQEYLSITPCYKVINENGPDHDKYFTIGIFFGEDLIAEGKGKSKQEAEQKAAENALKIKNWLE